jgi:hypothetical protein
MSVELKELGSFKNVLDISQKIFPLPIIVISLQFSRFKSLSSIISLSKDPLYQLTILLEGNTPDKLNSLSIPSRRSLSAPQAKIIAEYLSFKV